MKEIIKITSIISVTDEMNDIVVDPHKEKVYKMKFMDKPISVPIEYRLNPIFMMLLVNIEFIHQATRKGVAYMIKLKENGIVFDDKLEQEILNIIKNS